MILSIFSALLFFVLIPGMFVSVPKKVSPLQAAMMHSAVFGVAVYVVRRFVGPWLGAREGMEDIMNNTNSMVMDASSAVMMDASAAFVSGPSLMMDASAASLLASPPS